ncbi:LOW QUALITY PROTEIN: anthocyanidin 3-O-glucosyltransferase 4-like [Oryza brachyantha]|uniref:LOW QUALITY PROTEIN: anthocyanidin 3-O-glucosyltransferase 4-like n=1 Tax=Oryza brachyantha TaxID=4533 RepID=UPI001AD9F530|nr:LOW QUALITY PROTEIN: anthocyanidin 3-O-glucosyltransferase 4-like [Oryza brachyantha]
MPSESSEVANIFIVKISSSSCDHVKLAQSNGGSARIIQWNVSLADELSVPGVLFLVTGAFSTITLGLIGAVRNDAKDVTVPIFPGRELRILTTELPEFLRTSPQVAGRSEPKKLVSRSRPSSYFGAVVNTFFDLEGDFCEMYVRDNHAKRAYFVGPVSPPPLPESGESPCLDLLSSKSARSVVYACFGSLAHVSEAQLDELAMGLEAAEKPILWVVDPRGHGWTPPEGWEERVGDDGMVVRGWAPQTAILAHPSVGAFVTQCGWNSVLEAVGAGVPVLTWPMVCEQFITERPVTAVLGIGERLWGRRGVRSTRDEEKEVVPAKAVAKAVSRFMEPGGAAETARSAIKELAVKARAAVADGGSSYCDLRRLIDDLMRAK